MSGRPIPNEQLVPWWEWKKGKRPPGWTDADERTWSGENPRPPRSRRGRAAASLSAEEESKLRALVYQALDLRETGYLVDAVAAIVDWHELRHLRHLLEGIPANERRAAR